ncbi:hypothetical protein ABIB30_005489, partial [Pedobacter sp. UYP1]
PTSNPDKLSNLFFQPAILISYPTYSSNQQS